MPLPDWELPATIEPASASELSPLVIRNAEFVAALLLEVGATSVLDLNCWYKSVALFLPESITYIAAELPDFGPTPDAIMWSPSGDGPPQIKTDAVIVDDVLPYVEDNRALLTALSKRHRYAIVAYVGWEGRLEPEPIEFANERFDCLHRNDYSHRQLKDLFEASNWSVLRMDDFAQQGRSVWLLAAK